jgi:hypothetical protein
MLSEKNTPVGGNEKASDRLTETLKAHPYAIPVNL